MHRLIKKRKKKSIRRVLWTTSNGFVIILLSSHTTEKNQTKPGKESNKWDIYKHEWLVVSIVIKARVWRFHSFGKQRLSFSNKNKKKYLFSSSFISISAKYKAIDQRTNKQLKMHFISILRRKKSRCLRNSFVLDHE